MPKTVEFHKMVASGNDFVVVDNRKKVVKNPKRFTQEVCPQHTSVGADGVLLLENSRKNAFKMRIINSDGSEAEACGNGFRCIALYAKKKLGFPNRFHFDSISGTIEAAVEKNKICVGLAKPKGLKKRAEIQVLGHRLHYSFLNTGVPHVVIFVEGLSKVDVKSLGRAIRKHKAFAPKGTNVNFVEVKSRKEIQIRTYERGVEDETLACGTGSTASAIISSLLGYTKSPVRVKTKSGEVLTVHFTIKGTQIQNVKLEGTAKAVYEGKLRLNS